MERGPAGNTSLAAAFAMAREMPEDGIIVVQETEYTGAGKHPIAQLNLARQLGIAVERGDPRDNVPGRTIVIPEHPSQLGTTEVDLDRIRRSYLRNAFGSLAEGEAPSDTDVTFLAADINASEDYVRTILGERHDQR
jgi:hypothetical protein